MASMIGWLKATPMPSYPRNPPATLNSQSGTSSLGILLGINDVNASDLQLRYIP